MKFTWTLGSRSKILDNSTRIFPTAHKHLAAKVRGGNNGPSLILSSHQQFCVHSTISKHSEHQLEVILHSHGPLQYLIFLQTQHFDTFHYSCLDYGFSLQLNYHLQKSPPKTKKQPQQCRLRTLLRISKTYGCIYLSTPNAHWQNLTFVLYTIGFLHCKIIFHVDIIYICMCTFMHMNIYPFRD